MIEEESAEMVANAIWSEDITTMTADQLDQLAILQWDSDPDVGWDELGLSNEAGADRHGQHTDEQMMYGPDGKVEETL